jgi:hypothetical protein
MTTKKHEDELRQQEEVLRQEEEAAARKRHVPPATGEVRREPTADPMATPPYDVHAPNPPSPPGGEK